MLVLLATSLASAQSPGQPLQNGCFGAGGPRGAGGSFQGGASSDGANRTGRGNGSFGGREPLPEANLSFDPEGPVTMQPGTSAIVMLVVRNDGADPLSLNVTTGGFGRGGFTPPVNATLDVATLDVAPGATGTATLTLTAASDAPDGCNTIVSVRANEAGTNRTTQGRLFVQIPSAQLAPSSPTTAASPAAASTKTVPSPGIVAALACGALAVLALPRRR